MTFRRTSAALAAGLVASLATAGIAAAQEPMECRKVVFSDVGWSDISATTALASTVLGALGYQTETKILSVPVTYTALSTDDVDVFLGNWMPTMEADIAPYREAGTVDILRTNLTGAKYTLATNKAGAELGIADFAGIAAHKDALEGKIYGIEPATTATACCWRWWPGTSSTWAPSRSSKAANRGCWRRSRAPRPPASRSSSWAGSRIR